MNLILVACALIGSDWRSELAEYCQEHPRLCEAFPITPKREVWLSRYECWEINVSPVLAQWHEVDIQWCWKIVDRYATPCERRGLMEDVRLLAQRSREIEQRIINRQGYMTLMKNGKKLAYRFRADPTPYVWSPKRQWYFWCGHPLRINKK